jgi:hypothetical protein
MWPWGDGPQMAHTCRPSYVTARGVRRGRERGEDGVRCELSRRAVPKWPRGDGLQMMRTCRPSYATARVVRRGRERGEDGVRSVSGGSASCVRCELSRRVAPMWPWGDGSQMAHTCRPSYATARVVRRGRGGRRWRPQCASRRSASCVRWVLSRRVAPMWPWGCAAAVCYEL